jgi:hypothetical protein
MAIDYQSRLQKIIHKKLISHLKLAISMKFKTYSYRFGEQVLNSKLSLKHEIEDTLKNLSPEPNELSRPHFNEILENEFVKIGWKPQPSVFSSEDDAYAKMDFLKERIGVEVEFGHSSFIGIDLLKFQVSSYSALDKIDVGVYMTTTKDFQKTMKTKYNQNWEGSLTFEKVLRYLPHFKSAIQVPVYVIGIDDV